MHIFSAFTEKPKGIYFASQEPGEEIIFVLRKAFITNLPWIFISFLGILLPSLYMRYILNHPGENLIGSPKFENILIVTWYVLVIVYTLESFITWYFNVYIVTKQRVVDIDFKPLFNKRVSETTYDKVEDSSFAMNNIFQTFFNYGDVYLQTAAEKREFEFHSVPKPARVQDVISDLAADA